MPTKNAPWMDAFPPSSLHGPSNGDTTLYKFCRVGRSPVTHQPLTQAWAGSMDEMSPRPLAPAIVQR